MKILDQKSNVRKWMMSGLSCNHLKIGIIRCDVRHFSWHATRSAFRNDVRKINIVRSLIGQYLLFMLHQIQTHVWRHLLNYPLFSFLIFRMVVRIPIENMFLELIFKIDPTSIGLPSQHQIYHDEYKSIKGAQDTSTFVIISKLLTRTYVHKKLISVVSSRLLF